MRRPARPLLATTAAALAALAPVGAQVGAPIRPLVTAPIRTFVSARFSARCPAPVSVPVDAQVDAPASARGFAPALVAAAVPVGAPARGPVQAPPVAPDAAADARALPAQASAAGAPGSDSAPEEPVAVLLELLALDLAHEALDAFEARVAPGGDLAHVAEVRALVARALFAVGREADAAALLARDDAAGDEARPLAVTRAWLAMQQDELDEALRLLLRAERGRTVPRFPDDPDALLLLARVFARRGDWFAAEAPAARFLDVAHLHPDTHTALHVLARAAVERGDAEAAGALFERRDAARRWAELWKVRRLQVRRSPDDPLPRLGLALLYLEVEEWEAARGRLEALVARWPDHGRAWFHLAECRRRQGLVSGALLAYGRALSLDPDHLPARANRAMLWLELGRTEDARAELEAIVAGPAGEDPGFLPVHLALARLLLDSQGEDAAAARYAIYRRLGGREPLEPR